jgi:mRNA interferase RelE/StbE
MSDDTNLTADDIERIEGNYDILLFKLAAYESANQETIPGEVVHRLIGGEAPLLVWREHRALSHEALAEAAGVTVADIDLVERRDGDLGLRKMVALAKVLRIDPEDLLPWLETADAT